MPSERCGPDDGGIENRFAGRHTFDGTGEVEVDGVLEDVTAGAGGHGLFDESFLGVHAQHQHSGVWRGGENRDRRERLDRVVVPVIPLDDLLLVG